MNRSVVIIGKGPSVIKSTKEFVDSFDDVALCNFPPMEGYEKHIGNRATHHFLNAHDPNPYSKERLNSLGLRDIFNTSHTAHDGSDAIIPDHKGNYWRNYGEINIPAFKKNYGFDPSCGILAFCYFVEHGYRDIGLVGFDFFKNNEKAYYYSVNEVQPSLRYLYTSGGKTPYNSEGVRIQETTHDAKKSEQFVLDMAEKYKINLRKP